MAHIHISSLADYPELIGFFSYSREDDDDSKGALSALRDRMQRELRGQLGRSVKTLRLWQDKEAIAPGRLWESEIKTAIEQSVFFIPIITPTVVNSQFCRVEFESFLAREQALGRSDLVFPILYIRVPSLEDEIQRHNDPVISILAKRQYVDWREFRHRDVYSTNVSEAIERFCGKIVEALTAPYSLPEELEAKRRSDEEEVRKREEGDARRRAEEEQRRQNAETERRAEQEERRKKEEEKAGQCEAKRSTSPVTDIDPLIKTAASGESASTVAAPIVRTTSTLPQATHADPPGDSRKARVGIGRKIALAVGIVVAFFVMIAFMDVMGWLFRQLVNMLRSLLGF